MDIKAILQWTLIIFVIFVAIYLIINNTDLDSNPIKYSEFMINVPKVAHETELKWSRAPSCKYKFDDTTSRVLEESNILNTDGHNAVIIFPCGYNNIDDEIKSLPSVYYKASQELSELQKPTDVRIFIIDGADEITAKNYLWKNIYGHHGMKKALDLSPNTYLLTGPQKEKDLNRLINEHTPGKMYILKKNVQRQTGLELTDSIDTIKQNNGGYVLAQELLENSYLVNGRKINLRVYIIIICHKDNTDVYIFNNGFMYYTKQKFMKGSKERDNHITTGYVDRDVYDKNPLTHDDFKTYLDLSEGFKYHESNEPRTLYDNEKAIRDQGFKVSNIVFKRIEKMLADVFISFKGVICRKTDSKGDHIPIYDDYSVQIFGADVAINDQLQPQIIEVNKGPDLSPKDDRDGRVKRKMFKDVLETIGVTNKSDDNGLILILEM